MKIEDAFVSAILSGTCIGLLHPMVLEVFTSAILEIFYIM